MVLQPTVLLNQPNLKHEIWNWINITGHTTTLTDRTQVTTITKWKYLRSQIEIITLHCQNWLILISLTITITFLQFKICNGLVQVDWRSCKKMGCLSIWISFIEIITLEQLVHIVSQDIVLVQDWLEINRLDHQLMLIIIRSIRIILYKELTIKYRR